MIKNKYALITPARNEESYIELTLASVLKQSLPPIKWIIVSDGSTDRTDEIVLHYSKGIDFIEFISARSIGRRNFGSKVNAFNNGYRFLQNCDYDFIGNLDADVSFGSHYFERLLECFPKNPRLGLCGGIIQELVNGHYLTQNISKNSVAGAVQLFRRECFNQIGGYTAMPMGGIDAAAEITARKHGWDVMTFPELKVLHHRRVANAGGNIIRARFRQGRMYQTLGYHPLFQILRSFGRLLDPPYLVGSAAMMMGFLWNTMMLRPPILKPDVVSYLRDEQIKRLRSMLPF